MPIEELLIKTEIDLGDEIQLKKNQRARLIPQNKNETKGIVQFKEMERNANSWEWIWKDAGTFEKFKEESNELYLQIGKNRITYTSSYCFVENEPHEQGKFEKDERIKVSIIRNYTQKND